MTTSDAMLDATFALPDQLRWAARLDTPEVPAAGRALVTGMGGSGIAGNVAAAVAGQQGRLVLVHKGYELPGWAVSERPLVVAVSYSGNTEETLSAVETAIRAGLPGVAVSTGGALVAVAAGAGWPHVAIPGGLQPRAALGYLAGSVVRLLAGAGILPDQREALEESAAVVSDLFGPERAGPGVALAEDLADGLDDRIPVIYGAAGPGVVAAQRWKTQINENAKRAAFWSELPELDHNEVVGWEALPEVTRRHVGVVALRDRGDHPRVSLRFDLTAQAIADGVGVIGEVWSQGETVLARLTSLMAVGDLVSLALAEQAGLDPSPIPVIDGLKQRLSEEHQRDR